jgi:superfamily II DNA or RNA helicase
MTEAFRYPFEDKVPLHDYQRDSVKVAEGLGVTHKQPRLALYYKTGAGKTRTALACLKVMGQTQALVVAPPTTHTMWQETGEQLGITVDTWSHALFRQKERRVSKTEAIIVDEFHMLGGYKAQGFKKLERIAGTLQAPLVIASATPNYNDVERCYCIQRIVDRRATEGGYLSFIYKHCNTDVNPWGHVPKVNGFLHYPDAATFLADLPNVEYIEDDLVFDIEDEHMVLSVPEELMSVGLDRRRERVIASAIEMKHSLVNHMLVSEENFLTEQVAELLAKVMDEAPTPVLVFAVHTQVAYAALRSLSNAGYMATVVTGSTSKLSKDTAIEAFRTGQLDALVGTQTLATGTDGLDKMCDALVILDDTEDNAMRRQLIGRIMPRGGATTEAHTNRVIRVVPEPSPGP